MKFIINIFGMFGFSVKTYRLIIWYLLGKIDGDIATHWLTDWNVRNHYGYYAVERNRRAYYKERSDYKRKKNKINY